MPLPILIGVTLFSFLILLVIFRRIRHGVIIYSILVIWLRYVLMAFHEITLREIVAGFSINAISSILVVVIGLLFINLRMLRLWALLPVYVIIVLCIVSGVVNGEIIGAFDAATKWAYFIVLMLALYESMAKIGEDRFLYFLVFAFSVPVSLQLFSLVLGISKGNELNGAASFIGGYNHEAAFSVVLLTFITLITLTKTNYSVIRSILFAIGVFGLVIANYRTAMLAVLPIVANYIFINPLNAFVAKQRAVMFAAIFPLALLAIYGLALVFHERFADLIIVFSGESNLIKAPFYFTEGDKDLFSARVYIWNQYIYGYLGGEGLEFLVGQGPGSWRDHFSTYAHNTAVHTLFVLGPIGVLLLLAIWASFFMICLVRTRGAMRRALIAANVGFIILNQATMPHWLIEGNILYALICAVILYEAYTPAGPFSRSQYDRPWA